MNLTIVLVILAYQNQVLDSVTYKARCKGLPKVKDFFFKNEKTNSDSFTTKF